MRDIRRQPFIKLFAPKRKGRGAMWASLVGISLGAAVFGAARGRGRRKDLALPLQNAVKNFSSKINFNKMDDTALTEFSEELLTSALNKNTH